MMKKFFILIFLLLIATIIITGCTSNRDSAYSSSQMQTTQKTDSQNTTQDAQLPQRNANFSERPNGERPMQSPEMNNSDPNMQARFEEMQKLAEEACQGKSKGDSCVIQNPGGGMNGNCVDDQELLTCRPERNNGVMPKD
jgi:hypothetical protein